MKDFAEALPACPVYMLDIRRSCQSLHHVVIVLGLRSTNFDIVAMSTPEDNSIIAMAFSRTRLYGDSIL